MAQVQNEVVVKPGVTRRICEFERVVIEQSALADKGEVGSSLGVRRFQVDVVRIPVIAPCVAGV